MFATRLMRSVVDEFRPEGLPSEDDLETMTAAQLTELATQQTRIIATFRQQAAVSVGELRSHMDALQAFVPPESYTESSTGAEPRQRLAPGLLGLRPRNPLVDKRLIRPTPIALLPRRPPFRR